MSSVDDLITIPIEDGYFYTVETVGLQFRNPAITGEKRFNLEKLGELGPNEPEYPVAVLTTGLSYNLVPSSIQNRFFELLLKDVRVI